MTGATGYQGGLSAELIAETTYLENGCEILARRWRGTAGEIDLILRNGSTLVFVEVKKARNHGAAAARVSARQRARIMAAAEEYLGHMALGLDTEMRFDVALVDQTGRLTVLEGVFF